MRILIDSIYSSPYIAYKIGTDLLELCKHGKIYHLNLTIKLLPCWGVATEGQTALPPPVLAAHPAAPCTIKMSTRFRGIACKNIVPVGQQKVLTLRSVRALQTYVCKCMLLIGWWAHQADNRSRWLVRTFATHGPIPTWRWWDGQFD